MNNIEYNHVKSQMKETETLLKKLFKVKNIEGRTLATKGNIISFVEERITSLQKINAGSMPIKEMIQAATGLLESQIDFHNYSQMLFLNLQKFNIVGLEEKNELSHMAACLTGYFESSAKQIYYYTILIEHLIAIGYNTSHRLKFLRSLEGQLQNKTITEKDLNFLQDFLKVPLPEIESKLKIELEGVEKAYKENMTKISKVLEEMQEKKPSFSSGNSIYI